MSLVDLLALSLIPLEWRRTLGDSLRHGRAPADLLQESIEARGNPDGPTVVGLRQKAAQLIAESQDRSLDVVAWSDPRYPGALAAIFDPPPILWVHGSAEALARPAVAIVGSRAGSPYGLAVARRLAADLAARGVIVVSGLARGVDSAAHRGALEGGGTTVAVLGSGVDVIYPAEHRALAKEIAVRARS